jgi:hypothetical protein
MFSVRQVPMSSFTPYSTIESSPALKIMQMLGFEKSYFSFPDPRHGSSLSLQDSISPIKIELAVEATMYLSW